MINLIHLSDFHFSAFPQFADSVQLICSIDKQKYFSKGLKYLELLSYASHDQSIIEIAAAFIRDQFGDYDGILVSGDLATRGFEADLELAYDYVLKPSLHLNTFYTAFAEPTLNVNEKPIILLPGNHDRYDDLAGKCGGKQFDTTFKSEWPAGLRGVQAKVLTGASGESITLVCADFTLSTWWNTQPRGIPERFGQGRSTQKLVNELVRVSEEVKLDEPDSPIVWVCHFPPAADQQKIPNKLKLVDHHRVIKAAKKFGVEYIISGHIHNPTTFNVQGITVIAAGSMCVPNRQDGCWIQTLSFNTVKRRATLIRRQLFQFDFESASFISHGN